MSRGIPVIDGDWSAAIREAVARKGEPPGDGAEVIIISPIEPEQEEATDEQTR